MEEQALAHAHDLAERFIQRMRGDLIDGRMLVQVALAGYLAASGVPNDQAVAMVERLTMQGLVMPAPRNPMYHGIPWMVSGPVSGVPYYAD
jgi:hypothetical protein